MLMILLASYQQTCMTYTIAVCTVKTPDDGQRNSPKHVEFYFKNKFEKLVHLVGSVIRIYHDARSPERQMQHTLFMAWKRLINSLIYRTFQVQKGKIKEVLIRIPFY